MLFETGVIRLGAAVSFLGPAENTDQLDDREVNGEAETEVEVLSEALVEAGFALIVFACLEEEGVGFAVSHDARAGRLLFVADWDWPDVAVGTFALVGSFCVEGTFCVNC